MSRWDAQGAALPEAVTHSCDTAALSSSLVESDALAYLVIASNVGEQWLSSQGATVCCVRSVWRPELPRGGREAFAVVGRSFLRSVVHHVPACTKVVDRRSMSRCTSQDVGPTSCAREDPSGYSPPASAGFDAHADPVPPAASVSRDRLSRQASHYSWAHQKVALYLPGSRDGQ